MCGGVFSENSFNTVTLIVLLASMTEVSSSEQPPSDLSSCNHDDCCEPFQPEELNQMISKGAAAGRASTLTNTLVHANNNEIDGKQSSGNTDMSMEGAIDTTGQLMSMSIDMAIPNGRRDANQQIDLYLIESDMYIKMDIAGMGEQWIKQLPTKTL